MSSTDFVVTSTAVHFGAGHEQRIAPCRKAVRAGSVHSIAHYVNRVFEFGIDVLADPALAGQLTETGVEGIRAQVQLAGQELCYHMIPLDRDLQEVQCGDLIRMVLHGVAGVMICDTVVPGEHLVGFVLDPSAKSYPELPLTRVPIVEDADRAIAAIVDSLRAEVSLGTQNPGGWSTTRPDVSLPHVPGTPPAASDPGSPRITDEEDRALRDICSAAVSVGDLHYVAHHHEGVMTWSADCFDHRDMSHFFVPMSIPARRGFYDNFGRQFRLFCRQLGRVAFPVVGSLRRIVLDVEQGGVFFYSLSRTDHLVGVTLDQRRVSYADAKIAQLAVLARQRLLRSR